MLEAVSETLGSACGRWALGSVVLIALVTSEYSGIGTLPALPLAALTVTLAAFCEPELNAAAADSPEATRSRKSPPRNFRDFLDFAIIWLDILAQLAAGATCARIASATVDYMSEGKSRIWLFGYESHSLGEPWPDVLGVTIVVVITALFMMGLERSPYFFAILYTSIIFSTIFFLTVGSARADRQFWKHESILPLGWKGMVSTAAMCSFGFVDAFPKSSKCYNLKLIGLIFVPLISYCSVAGVFTLLTDFRELTGTAVPLVRVFEVRDVDWARPVMAASTICVVCVALTEICPILHGLLVRLASREWRLLSKSLAYENPSTGSPVLAVFTAGSLMSILAFACPLSYLVRLLNVSPLLRHVLQAIQVINLRYRSEQNDEDDFCQASGANVNYSRLNQPSSRAATNVNKNGPKFLWFLPKNLRKKRNGLNVAVKSKTNVSEERECLLMGDYSPDLESREPLKKKQSNASASTTTTTTVLNEQSLIEDSDSDCNNLTTASPKSTDGDDEDDGDMDTEGSSTDVDVAVQEYKERIKVATLSGNYTSNGRRLKVASAASHRCVLILTFLMFLLNVSLALGFLLEVPVAFWVSVGAIAFCTLAIAVQPQRSASENEDRSLLVPYVPSMSWILNSLTFSSLLVDIWPGVVLWIFAGLVLCCRCECCEDPASNRKHRIRLRAPPRGSMVSTLVPSHRNHLDRESAKRLTHVDTILIAR